jgi:hypothetical protein
MSFLTHRLSSPDRRKKILYPLYFVITALIAACNPPFPGPPECIPDCDFPPAIERCHTLRDSAITKHIPTNRLVPGLPRQSELPIDNSKALGDFRLYRIKDSDISQDRLSLAVQ